MMKILERQIPFSDVKNQRTTYLYDVFFAFYVLSTYILKTMHKNDILI